jgi:RNA polymerase sigma-70 factor (ECF subfamily)
MLGRQVSVDRELIRRLYAYVAFRIGDGPDAEDVVSDTIERALRYGRSFDTDKGEPIAWLLGIARRRIATLYSHELELSLQESDGVAAFDAPEHEIVERLTLQSAVASLPARDRELVSLHYGADLTASQIADLLDLRLNTVEVALHRTRGRLRTLLESEPGWRNGSEGGEARL